MCIRDRADRVLFDKTGTLTLGRPEPVDLSALRPEQKSVALALARSSRHPLSEALRRALEREGVAPSYLTDIREVAGTGVSANFGLKHVALRRPDGVVPEDCLATTLAIDGEVSATILSVSYTHLVVWVSYLIVFVGTIVRRKEPHIYVANWFFLAFIITVAMLHLVNNLTMPASIFGSKSYSAFAGVQDALTLSLIHI